MVWLLGKVEGESAFRSLPSVGRNIGNARGGRCASKLRRRLADRQGRRALQAATQAGLLDRHAIVNAICQKYGKWRRLVATGQCAVITTLLRAAKTTTDSFNDRLT
jgi:hypothetical protein